MGANRNFNTSQNLEREVKELFASVTIADSVAATATADLTTDIVYTKVAAGPSKNGHTITLVVEAAAANPTDTILAAWTGTAAATTITVTPNDGTNTGAPGTATLNLTNDVIISTTTDTSARNTNTFTLQVAAAAANPTDTILATTSGTSAATVLTITPNDGTNNTATPVDLTTAELAELIATGSVVGKTVTVTDASSLLDNLTATGGGAQALADSGEGDGVVGTFSGGSADAAVDLTTEELVELINTGAVDGKTVTVTDASNLRALVTATGGDETALAEGGEGDDVEATFSGGQQTVSGSMVGIASISRTAVGEWTVTLEDKYSGGLRMAKAKVLRSTAVDLRGQLKSEAVASTKTVVFFLLTGATATDATNGDKLFIQLDLKNSASRE